MNLVELPAGTFTNRELERLMAYRAAVAAGFYSDWDGIADPAGGPDAAAAPDINVPSAEADAGAEPPAH